MDDQPKKTGKRGVGPLDVEEDFANPTTVPGSEAEAILAATEEVEETEPAEQLELEGVKVDVPMVIRNGKILCEFVRPHFERDGDGTRSVGFEFSFPLTVEHDKYLPTEVLQEWAHMRDGNVSLSKVESIAPQTLNIGLVPDDIENDLVLVAAAIDKPILAKVEEKGSGKKSKIIRFTFRAVVEQTEETARFAVDHHGDDVWISIDRTQGSLLT